MDAKWTFTLLYSISSLCFATCLMCTKCTNIALLFDNPVEFPLTCEANFVEANVCQLVFHMNYLTKQIHLNLTGANNTIGNYHIDLLVENKSDEPKIMNANATYICKTVTDCAKVFYKLTIQTLIKNEPILKELQAALYDPTVVNVQQCSNKQNQPVTCQNGYGCHGVEIIENGETDFEGECRNASTITIFPRQYFRITLVQGDPPLSSDWNHLGFTCNKNNLCNSQQEIKKMVILANDFYPWEFIGLNASTKKFVNNNYLLLFSLMLFAYNFFD
ncbi:unnamed protein product [Rotaria socialis]